MWHLIADAPQTSNERPTPAAAAAPATEPDPDNISDGPTGVLAYLQSLHRCLRPQSRKAELPRDVCAACGASFASRQLLFAHIKTEGHAELTLRPRDAIQFASVRAEERAVSFLRWLLADLQAGSAEVELPGLATLDTAWLQTYMSAEVLSTQLDSGESMLAVLAARLLLTPKDGASRALLLGAAGRAAAGKHSAAVFEVAVDFEEIRCVHCTARQRPATTLQVHD
jgi:hypothetical protein